MNNKDKKIQELDARLKGLGFLFIELDGEKIYSSECYTSDSLQEIKQ